jgi:hypothetical protein
MLSIDRFYGAWPVPRGFSLQRKETVMADNKIQGEGDYISGKKYQDMQHEFAEKGPVEQKAREAEEALDGPEGEALEQARKDTGEGKTH